MAAGAGIQLSIVVPVGLRRADIRELYAEYKRGVSALGMPHEFIFVLDGPRPDVAQGLKQLLDAGERFTIVSLTRPFGEATAIMAGFERAAGAIVMTLPAYFQIDGGGIVTLVSALRDCDMACGHRSPRRGSLFEKLRRRMFHRLLRWITRQKLRDIGCGARAMRRQVLEEITLYGDQHRFLPLLADRQGFRVREVSVPQSPKDRFEGHYAPGEYAHRFLDIFTVFFLVRFTKKPLRFFGMMGAIIFTVGALLIADLVADRLFFDTPLADRPALLLSSLLVVLGLQLIALGLLGELIIFTHARGIKDYQVDEVIQFRSDSPAQSMLDYPAPGEAQR